VSYYINELVFKWKTRRSHTGWKLYPLWPYTVSLVVVKTYLKMGFTAEDKQSTRDN